MRVLGVDPGLTRCGLGIVDGEPGRPVSLVDVHWVRTLPGVPTGDRLLEVERAVIGVLARHRPDVIAIEALFSQHNVRTVMGTAQAAGVTLAAAARAGVPVRIYTPSEVKAAVTGSGRADKHQVAAMVARLLRLPAPPEPADAADALALAICHIWRGVTRDRLAAAAG